MTDIENQPYLYRELILVFCELISRGMEFKLGTADKPILYKKGMIVQQEQLDLLTNNREMAIQIIREMPWRSYVPMPDPERWVDWIGMKAIPVDPQEGKHAKRFDHGEGTCQGKDLHQQIWHRWKYTIGNKWYWHSGAVDITDSII